VSYPLAALPFSVRCPSCRAVPGQRCATRLRRGYHLSRADKAVRADNRTQAERTDLANNVSEVSGGA
jgi:hypothetical protein